ncbi:hypothetical protein [Micromonospora yangpuensis]|uniref:Uncharacterized protein n=1 Tax=Micromonospora yangpuensis TaxID=683228 RepID=A0A1C6VH44_9ACTN|nr:hypothetical protein [Micromonospora yangpuensis]GGL99560.1 hypothetical protein GCM10012279_16150 [Micromonospora yangpuensis]SCL65669.1 hypothetical protein GA0070617_5832 [Micromonospora yangpuensis]
MADPDQPARSIVFHNTIHGGQQAMASDKPVMVQYNGTSGPGERFDALLRILKEQVTDFDDPDRAGREVATIEAARTERATDRRPVLTSLEELAALAAAGGTLAETVGKMIELVSQHWPL